MAHIHTEQVVISISSLASGDHTDCEQSCVITPEVLANLEEVVKEMLGDSSLIVEAAHEH